ncbi:mismatch-specific DNA-glycosylase [Pseudalkalibacillus salsuginis]|uniref:mismatch-specific DNA-glycosylase n=1 Tax=Pseudalkalibacillus salsuginis TaxID=2910972 RepID=UPI001F2EEA35|nr:mismatch-specific DNA-glycosylase [Pseudalkalibacillus salsuginis]MCF6410675.1 mismatch-specific DNA-glycosylase [Pseudalkalibacillus salsuginis]
MLTDLLKNDLKVVFCGTAVGLESSKKKLYYANPTNKFWSILYRTQLTPTKFSPNEYQKLLNYGIGLTDLVKGWSRNDKDISKEQYDINRLNTVINKNKPAILCFNGKQAAKQYLNKKIIHYGLQKEKINTTKIFVAPSTSGAASGYWDERYWFELAKLVQSNK